MVDACIVLLKYYDETSPVENFEILDKKNLDGITHMNRGRK